MSKKQTPAPVPASRPAAPEQDVQKKAPPPQQITAVEMGARQREISVSEFFTKNRHLLGFDNPRKALLTCVKEAVDNALDACEEAGILPDVSVRLEVVSNGEPLAPSQASKFRITVTDNGPGIIRQHIPRIFAKLLYGSKFHRMRMSRGQQGIGISAAGMYGQLTTGKPVKIISRTGSRAAAHFFEVQIDTKKNEPLVHENKQIEWEQTRGTQVALEVEGKYQKGRASVDEWLEQTTTGRGDQGIRPHVSRTAAVSAGDQAASLWHRIRHAAQDVAGHQKPHRVWVSLGRFLPGLSSTRGRHL
jgi:DNA topoisomerase-6 subunit B